MNFRTSAVELHRFALLLTVMACMACFTPGLHAQTAHFSGAVRIPNRTAQLSRSQASARADLANTIQTTPSDFGAVDVGASSANSIAMVFTFDAAVTVGSTIVVTQGAIGLDFTDAGGGTCTANTSYLAGNSCTVNVTFQPLRPGLRYGAAELLDGSGNLIALGYVQGKGVGPMTTFANSTSGVYAPSQRTILGGSFGSPVGVAVDGSGNVLVADRANNIVKKILAAGGYKTVHNLGSGFQYPNGVAADGAGNVFVGDTNNHAVKEIIAAGGYTTINTVGHGFNTPTGLSVDGSGNVYVADWDNNAVYEIVASSGFTSVKTLGSGFRHPDDTAVDGNGNVFVSDYGNSAVKEILAASGYTTVNTIGSGFNGPAAVALDASGNVYVADQQNSAVKEIVAAGGYTTVLTLGTGFSVPAGMATDASGNLFVTENHSRNVTKLDYADPPLLSFAPTNLGMQSSDSPQKVTVANNGNAALTLPAPVSGKNPSLPSAFKLDSATTCPQVSAGSQSGTLAKGMNCDYAIEFVPPAVATYSRSLTLTDDNLNAPSPNYATQSVRLSGTGVDVPFGSLGAVVDSTTLSAPVGQSDSLKVQGWVADPVDGAPLTDVNVYLDGTLIGTPTLGLARPGAAAAYKNTAYYFSGFELVYSASSLPLGTHQATVVANNSAGQSTILGPRTFTVATTAGLAKPFGGIGKAVDSVTFSNTVAQAHSLRLQGWVADPQDGAPLSNVKVYIDGTPIGTPTLGLARPDVAAEYNNAAFLNSGFRLLYPASTLALGTHNATLVAIASGGRSTTFGPVTFTVAATAGLGSPFGGIGLAVDSVTLSTNVSQSHSLRVQGWAADPQDGAPLTNVKVYIDGTLIGKPTLGLARTDVAATYGAAFLNSGFRLLHPASSVALGTHVVTVVATDSAGRSTTFTPRMITVQ